VFIRLQIPGLHVKLQGKLHMYNQLHVIVVYKEHCITLDTKLRCGCQLWLGGSISNLNNHAMFHVSLKSTWRLRYTWPWFIPYFLLSRKVQTVEWLQTANWFIEKSPFNSSPRSTEFYAVQNNYTLSRVRPSQCPEICQ